MSAETLEALTQDRYHRGTVRNVCTEQGNDHRGTKL